MFPLHSFTRATLLPAIIAMATGTLACPAHAEVQVRATDLALQCGSTVDLNQDGLTDFMVDPTAPDCSWYSVPLGLQLQAAAQGNGMILAQQGTLIWPTDDPTVFGPALSIWNAGIWNGSDGGWGSSQMAPGFYSFGVQFHALDGVHVGWFALEVTGLPYAPWPAAPVSARIVQIGWETAPGASMTLQLTDCDSNGLADIAEIAGNPALDCDANGQLDDCDIANQPSLDCDGNFVLDACQPPEDAMHEGTAAVTSSSLANVTVPQYGLVVPTSEITIEFWQRVNQANQQTTFRIESAVTNRCMVHAPWKDGCVYWDFGNLLSTGRLAYRPPENILGTWQHFAVQASQSGYFMRIYRNGVLEAQRFGSDTFTPVAQELILGGEYYDGTPGFSGALDEVRIWNYARTQEEIKASLHQSVDPATPGLVGYWRFDEEVGSLVAHDLAGGHHGNVNDAIWWRAPDQLCAPASDLDGDGIVSGTDLGVLLGAWGPCEPGAAADLDMSGTVDGQDMALLLAAWS